MIISIYILVKGVDYIMAFTYEHKLDHPYKGLTSYDLKDPKLHDEILLIRAIEQHKEQIRKDPEILFPVIDRKTVRHIYKEYCSTQLDNLEDISLHYIKEAIDLTYL